MKYKKILGIAIWSCMPVVLWILSFQIGERTHRQDMEAVRQSVTRAAIQCYALEGEYPREMAKLEREYSLGINSDQFVVEYRFIAANLMPDITVLLQKD